MDFNVRRGSPSSSASSSDHHHHPNSSTPHHQNGHPFSSPSPTSDPMHSWWESISKARTRIHILSSLLPLDEESSLSLSSLADTDRPARSLLLSSAAYFLFSSALSSPSSGSGDDPLCQWLYETFLSSDPDLRLVVLSFLPLLTSLYLHRIHHASSSASVSLAGFEAVLLALYSSETKARNGKPITISIPDLSQPSLYHSPRNPIKSNPNSAGSQVNKPLVGVLSPPLEPQIAVKSTKRACIVGVALDCYYKQISQMPSWSKLDFCKFTAVWAGQDCPCTSDFDKKPEIFVENNHGFKNEDGFEEDQRVKFSEIENVTGRVKNLDIENDNSKDASLDARIPLPWELLQPILRILGHCLLGPLNVEEVKDAASVALRRLYARASHDLVPQAILATRSLIQLDNREREAVKAAAATTASAPGSNANTPSKAKKPEILLVSK
ncbi:beta-catenin-Tcf Lef signaling pathway component DRCTNNB1A [Olea europaea subsp. europaea]|uniref:Beta-catenin-Tcf Lef signaling pathway component DRCTNNB1A n=1 Tax=Olea europaea subsp. europaea TaxID=158383 RepID=A0A8S0PTU9_OLEEU|nr:beta-catenin-Tcf Lef signaling pathway component DRCTNNB1A [Olea europaea subsp. europaea]